jgi:hypothetical protein
MIKKMQSMGISIQRWEKNNYFWLSLIDLLF